MVFCNTTTIGEIKATVSVTILILIDGFLQFAVPFSIASQDMVTILILIDGFLQYNLSKGIKYTKKSHNPYFNRWFSAIG